MSTCSFSAQIMGPGTGTSSHGSLTCTATKIPFMYVFLFWEWRGLSPNFHIHVSVRDLYFPRIGSHILLQQNRQTDPGNIYKSLTDI
jgi:hypothetical protein